jgi:hypothetical protein
MCFAVSKVSGPVFMFCAPGLIFGGTEVVVSIFHVLRNRTCFRRYNGHQVPFSCFAGPDSFSTVSRASGPFFMFCAVGSRFQVLRSRTRFRRYRGRRVSFSSFARPNSFSVVPRVSTLVFMFCASGLIFGGAEDVKSHFHVLHALTSFPRYRGLHLPFSTFSFPDSFSAIPRASGPVFMFCAPGLVSPWYRGR